jgi:hypothetical protein
MLLKGISSEQNSVPTRPFHGQRHFRTIRLRINGRRSSDRDRQVGKIARPQGKPRAFSNCRLLIFARPWRRHDFALAQSSGRVWSSFLRERALALSGLGTSACVHCGRRLCATFALSVDADVAAALSMQTPRRRRPAELASAGPGRPRVHRGHRHKFTSVRSFPRSGDTVCWEFVVTTQQ